jgi:hypothetical protein
MHTRLILILTTFFSFFLCSCKKGTTPPAKTYDIYVAGSIESPKGGTVASFWKNGALVMLASQSESSSAYSIAVAGNDIYVAGNLVAQNGNLVAALWKNGVVTKLTDSTSNYGASAITVSGNDVYIAGSGPDGAVYWKNGSMVNLPSAGWVITSGIAVSGNDVYVAGTVNKPTGVFTATYWKNGTAISLTTGTQDSQATGIAVQGDDVYVSGTLNGFLNNTIVYWKNSVRVDLPDNFATSSSGGIALDGSNVYVAGQSTLPQNVGNNPGTADYMSYWKNGTLANPGGSGAANSGINIGGIAVAGSDVYVSGTFGYPCYWKNGILVQFAGNKGEGQGIAIAQH